MHMYVYTPGYKYNLSCASLQLLWRLDTYALVCGRTACGYFHTLVVTVAGSVWA